MSALVKQPTTLPVHLMSRASPMAKEVLKTSVGGMIGAIVLRLVTGLEVFSLRRLTILFMIWLTMNALLMALSIRKEIWKYRSANQG